MWLWLRFVSSLNELRHIQSRLLTACRTWSREGSISKIIMDFRRKEPLPNMYFCAEVSGALDDYLAKDVSLTALELRAIPQKILAYARQLTKDFSLTEDWDCLATDDSSYPHVSIGNYLRRLRKAESDTLQTGQQWYGGASVEEVLNFTVIGSAVGLMHVEDVLSQEHDTTYLRKAAAAICAEVKRAAGLPPNHIPAAYHMACASIPIFPYIEQYFRCI